MIDHRAKLIETSGRVKSRKYTPNQLHNMRNARRKAAKAAKSAKPASVASNDWKQAVPYSPGMKGEFYSTKEWRELRFQVLRESDGKCVYCGRSRKQHGVVIHIDHIKPRSKYPKLELAKDNLQVTCEDCNMGKGAQEV